MQTTECPAPYGYRMPITDLWLIGGFLGSGKTTVLNTLASSLASGAQGERRRVGVIVNDFGDLGVDGSLVRQGDDLLELNGGQIFCACLSGRFVEAITALVAREVESILVEASGLAKPAAMEVILRRAQLGSHGKLAYRGMLAVIDAARWSRISIAVNAAREQVVKADLLVINKIDLVDERTLNEVQASIAKLNSAAPIIQTTGGMLRRDELPAAPLSSVNADMSEFRGWDGAGRPHSGSYLPPRPMTVEEAHALIVAIAPHVLRAKGYIHGTRGDLFVSYSGDGGAAWPDQLEVRTTEPALGGRSYGIAIIAPGDVNVEEITQDAWAELDRRESLTARYN